MTDRDVIVRTSYKACAGGGQAIMEGLIADGFSLTGPLDNGLSNKPVLHAAGRTMPMVKISGSAMSFRPVRRCSLFVGAGYPAGKSVGTADQRTLNKGQVAALDICIG